MVRRLKERKVGASCVDPVTGERALSPGRSTRTRPPAAAEFSGTSAYARTLIEASLDPLVAISPEGKITDVNEATERATGLARDTLIGTDFADYFTEPDRARAGYREVLDAGLVRDYPLTLRHASGSTADVLYNASVYRDEAGKLQGVFAAARDVTEHKRMEDKLRQTNESFRLAFLEAPVGVCVLDAEGRFTRVNERLCELLGRTEEELLSTRFVDLNSPTEEMTPGRKLFAAMMAGEGSTCEYEDEYLRGDGERVWALVHASVFDDPLGENKAIAHLVDVTPRKHALEALRRSEERYRRLSAYLEQRVTQRTAALRAVVGDLEGFSYSVSHDLRAPLRAIDGFSQALLEDYADSLDDEGKRLLGIVRSSAVQMRELIDDILDFSRASRKEIRRTDIDMEELAHEVWRESAPCRGERDVTCSVEQLPHVSADRAMMHQVLANLIDNAIKFTSKKEHSTIEVVGRTDGDLVVYSVRDDGAGFDMAYSDKLFGVFQRLHGDDEFPGTGIGLAITKRIVEKHGGSVLAEGHVDEGATFTFALPVHPPQDFHNHREGEE